MVPQKFRYLNFDKDFAVKENNLKAAFVCQLRND